MLSLSILFRGMELEIEDAGIEKNEENKEYVKGILESVKEKSPCPDCGEESSKVQSQYIRTIADLPLATIMVILLLQVRRFFCINLVCKRKIFAERFPKLVKPYKRKTDRMEKTLSVIAHAEGGESGARTANSMAMKVSPDTMLRQIRRVIIPKTATPKVLGVDEFSFKKGQRYGTILIDLEKHQRVDVLPDRSAESFAQWLKDHPGVEIISRDRGQIYADGARQGAPNAIHVADRFHLVQNVREAVERTLSSHYKELKVTAEAIVAQTELNNAKTPEFETDNKVVEKQTDQNATRENDIDVEQINKVSLVEITEVKVTEQKSQNIRERQKQLSDESRERRLERYEQIKELSQQSMSGRAIARHLNIGRRTVRTFLKTDIFPERANPQRHSMIDKFVSYLSQRLQAGVNNSKKLWEEIKEQGFVGSFSLVRKFLTDWKKLSPLNLESKVPKPVVKAPSPKQTSFWLLGLSKEKTEEKKVEHQNFVEKLCNISSEITKARQLGIEFIEMLRNRQGGLLDSWLEKAKISGLIDLKNFASGIERDKDAVFNAMTLEWSNGQVEGNNNRIKMLKRQMYGRAKFDLLRARILSPT